MASQSSSRSSLPDPLERLVGHFVSAKRALASTTQVWRANEIVTTARASLEENAILRAKNAFIHQSLQQQLDSLRAVQYGIEQVGQDAQSDLKTTVAAVDAAHTRLQQTLSSLRDTIVAPSLQPHDAAPKTLHSFVDEAPISDLSNAIRQNIDNYKEASAVLSETVDGFSGSLDAIERLLSSPSTPDGLAKIKGHSDGESESPVPRLYRSLETHATEMAESLQSLVKHYDLCVTAIKHTEGGGEAARQAAEAQSKKSRMDGGDGAGSANVSVGSLQTDAPPLPMTDEERQEMMHVLDSDAAEVDDVVGEITEHSAAMEQQLAQIMHHVQCLESEYTDLRQGFKLIANVCAETPGCVSASGDFLTRWEEEKLSIQEKMEELEGLSEFYEGFLGAYDGLILEVARRRKVRERMLKIAKEAEGKIQKLYHDDVKEREAFRADHGEYLPSDIWSGLEHAPTKLEIRAGADDDGSIPELSKGLIDAAAKRMKTSL
ncbi:MAG: autophagy protein 17 [Bathelium mastoideum]|nr:MAG: autophagy protein 17 [Bathelium mastoideum]KAI9681872.1 MAG: autophagy protein 17 [Bathelium mastoideum]